MGWDRLIRREVYSVCEPSQIVPEGLPLLFSSPDVWPLKQWDNIAPCALKDTSDFPRIGLHTINYLYEWLFLVR